LRNIKATLNVFSKPYRKRPVQQISKRMVVAYRDGLVKVGVSVKTVNNNLGHIQCCFEYCIKHDLFEGSNPAKGLRLRCKDAAKNQRKAFSDVQVGEVFSGLLAGGREKVARGLLPTFLLYTGARAEELAQLRVGDVKQLQSNGAPADVGDPEAIWCFDLTDPDQRHKNEASKRLIPVHPDLWQLGLTRLLNRPASAPLFAELNAGASGRLSEAPSRWFCDRWLRDRCQIRDKRLVTHSLRHTVATKLKHNGCSDTIVAQILGHTLSGMGSRYAKDWELNKLNEAILTLGWDL
jgi:integrase